MDRVEPGISDGELEALPKWSLLALASHVVRNVEPLIAKEYPHLLSVIGYADSAATAGHIDDVTAEKLLARTRETVDHVWSQEHDNQWEYGIPADQNRKAAFSAIGHLAYALVHHEEKKLWVNDALNAISLSTGIFGLFFGRKQDDPAAMQTLRLGYEALKEATRRYRWTNRTPVPSHFFEHHARFLDDQGGGRPTILLLSQFFDAHFIELLTRDPERLLQLDSRQFERLVAELWNSFGYEVELTARTRDHGRDIVALSHWPTRTKVLIECKRYTSRKVGVEVVRSLHGTVELEGANKGIIATTSALSADAEKLIRQAPWRLEAKDFHGITQWLEHYLKVQRYSALGLDPPRELFGRA